MLGVTTGELPVCNNSNNSNSNDINIDDNNKTMKMITMMTIKQ